MLQRENEDILSEKLVKVSLESNERCAQVADFLKMKTNV